MFLGLTRLFIFNILISKIPITFIRLMFYRLILKLGKNSNICMNVKILYPGWDKNQISIGDNCAINPQCILDGRYAQIIIKNNVDIARGTWIFTLEHNPQSDYHEHTWGDVIIEDDVWIASRVIILPGVTIGKGSVVAAGSIVTKNVEPMSIVGGIPAKVIGTRRSKLLYKNIFFPYLWV